MKHSLLFLSILFMGISCTENSADKAQSKTTTTDTIKSQQQKASEDTIIPFHGLWATEKYISTLLATKSPRLSQADADLFMIPESYKERAFPCSYHEG